MNRVRLSNAILVATNDKSQNSTARLTAMYGAKRSKRDIMKSSCDMGLCDYRPAASHVGEKSLVRYCYLGYIFPAFRNNMRIYKKYDMITP